MKSRILTLLACLLVVSACTAAPEVSSGPTPALTPIRLPMGYIPDPQFAPVYVADYKGYFAEENIAIEFDYSYETDGIALVGAEEFSFTLGSGEQAVMARAKGLPIVYVMQWFQKYPIAVIAKDEAGIEAPSDLVGRQIGIPGFFGASYVGFEGLLHAVGLTDSDVDLVEIGFTQAEALAQDQVEAAVVYVNNEPVRLRLQEINLDEIDVADYVDMVGNGLMTNDATVRDHPELVEGMVRALLRGLRDVLADPDEAFDICKNYVEGLDATPETEQAQRAVLQASLEIWQAPRLGMSAAEAWSNTQEVLLAIDFIQEPVDLTAIWTNQFVEAAGVR
jgi:NitT/TauT family transport system substrate-binding protein